MSVFGQRTILVALTLVSVACGGSSSPVATIPVVTVPVPTTIRFAVDTLRLTQGEAQTVAVTVLDAQNREMTGTNPVLTSDAAAGLALTISGSSITSSAAGRAALVAQIGSVTARLPVVVIGHPGGVNPEKLVLGLRPYGVAAGENVALVTQLDGSTVTRFTLNPFRVTNTIVVGSIPTGISIDRAGTRALVANQLDQSVGIIDLATNQQTAKLTGASSTFRTIFSADGTRGYATLSGGALMVIDPAARTAITTVPIVPAGNGIAFGRGDSLIYLSSMFGGISIVNTKTNALVTTLPLSGTLQEIIASTDGNSLFVASESSTSVAVVPTATGAVQSSIQLGGPSFGMALSPDGKQLWVAQTTGSVVVIDAATRTIVKTITLGGVPRRVAFDRFGSVAVVSDEAGSVTLIH